MDGFVVAVAALIVRDGRVLALRRARDRDAGAGVWETVSGRLEPDEQPLVALRREIEEESALTVDVDPRPIDSYVMRRGERPMLVICYRARFAQGELRRSSEHDADAWWTPAEARANGMPPRLVDAVERALSD